MLSTLLAASPAFLAVLAPLWTLPSDGSTNFLMLVRWLHFLAGTTWVGLLYFFNLVNVPFMKEMDSATKGKIVPSLMPRALWWFRWGAVVTVLMGLIYFENYARTDAHNGAAKHGSVMGSFLVIWTAAWAVLFVLTCVVKIDKGPVLAVLVSIVVLLGCYFFLALNNHGWESNHTLAIGLGGGIGWVMMLNVWRFQKKIIAWTKANAANGTPIPDAAKTLARQAFLASRTNAYLSLPMLFLMGASSHYPMFGR
jgi:uncharacterized membrane protein